MLTVTEAAARLNISRFTLYRMIQNGAVPAVRTRGRNRVLVDPAALDAVMTPVAARPSPQVPDHQPFLTATEVAGMLRCGVETVRKMVNEGVLRAARNPGKNSHMRIHADSVSEYLNTQRVDAAS